MGLRWYQIKAQEGVKTAWNNGKKRVILCKPTGSGKTVTFADMAKKAVKNGNTVMVVVDRTELLEQAKDKLTEYGLLPQLITSGKTVRYGNSCYVATVQTLVNRRFPNIDFLIIDEAHKQIFDKILKDERYKDIYTIGATATPRRTGKMNQLSEFYDELIEPVTIAQLIAEGYLVPAITYGVKKDLSKVKTRGEDYDAGALFEAFDKPKLYADVVAKYKALTPNTKAICFCVNVEASQKQAREFNDAGIPAIHLDGKTPKAERKAILKAYKAGVFQVITNVDVLTAGFDEWTIETIILNLATKSLSKFLQMCGRGSRITPDEFKEIIGYLQKTHFNIIDMGGNVFMHGFWEDDREYSLNHKLKDTQDAAPVKECPEDDLDENLNKGCGALLHLSAAKCKHCGYIFPQREAPKPEDGEFVQLINKKTIPIELVEKSYSEMSIEELETVRVSNGYQLGWIVKLILANEKLKLVDYAIFRDFKNPSGWVAQMERIYTSKVKYFYYIHEPSETVWKSTKECDPERMANEEIKELDTAEFKKTLVFYGLTDNDELIQNF